MKKDNLRLVDPTKEEIERNIRWERIVKYYTQVITMDEINPKPLNRSGLQMKKSIKQLLAAIVEYGEIRSTE